MLTQYIKTFLSVFIVLMFILILQAIWLYIKELAGKDLDAVTIGKFLMYSTPIIVPLALPLSILLAAIMVFGSMSENYEFAAMKANGISLQRSMRSLTLIILTLGITSFFFANSVIPWGNLKQKNLRNNIAKKAPSTAITEGAFNQLGDVNIKVTKKSGDNGQFLEDVIIHKRNPRRYGNFNVIKSKNGELKSSLKSNIIKLVLTDGYYYEDMYPTNPSKNLGSPFIKTHFKEYVFNIDISALNSGVNLDEETVTDNQRMLRMDELTRSIDTFSTSLNQSYKDYRSVQLNRLSPKNIIAPLQVRLDTIKTRLMPVDYFERLPVAAQSTALDIAFNKVISQKANIDNRKIQVDIENQRIRVFQIEAHKKFVLGVACIILFFIGAPLGAIIRKGGMGLPLVIATLFFLTYHFIGIFAEKAASEGVFPAWFGAWAGTLIIFPMGIYITYRATTDQPLFEYNAPLNKFFARFKKKPKTEQSLS